MRYYIRMLCVLAVVIGLNVSMLSNWIPALFANIERGYYDAFSFIAVLCNNNPDETALHYLNANNYHGVLFFIFMSPRVLVSWLAFLAFYKAIFLDAPLSFFTSREKHIEVVVGGDQA